MTMIFVSMFMLFGTLVSAGLIKLAWEANLGMSDWWAVLVGMTGVSIFFPMFLISITDVLTAS